MTLINSNCSCNHIHRFSCLCYFERKKNITFSNIDYGFPRRIIEENSTILNTILKNRAWGKIRSEISTVSQTTSKRKYIIIVEKSLCVYGVQIDNQFKQLSINNTKNTLFKPFYLLVSQFDSFEEYFKTRVKVIFMDTLNVFLFHKHMRCNSFHTKTHVAFKYSKYLTTRSKRIKFGENVKQVWSNFPTFGISLA